MPREKLPLEPSQITRQSKSQETHDKVDLFCEINMEGLKVVESGFGAMESALGGTSLQAMNCFDILTSLLYAQLSPEAGSEAQRGVQNRQENEPFLSLNWFNTGRVISRSHDMPKNTGKTKKEQNSIIEGGSEVHLLGTAAPRAPRGGRLLWLEGFAYAGNDQFLCQPVRRKQPVLHEEFASVSTAPIESPSLLEPGGVRRARTRSYSGCCHEVCDTLEALTIASNVRYSRGGSESERVAWLPTMARTESGKPLSLFKLVGYVRDLHSRTSREVLHNLL